MRCARLLPLLIAAFAAFPANAWGETDDRAAGDYGGTLDAGTQISFSYFPQGDGSVGTIVDLNIRRPSCRQATCSFLFVGRADTDEGGRVDFIGSGSGVPLSRLSMHWASPTRVAGTWTRLQNEFGTVFELSKERFTATLRTPIAGAGAAASFGPGPLASAAATRPEYAAQLDPICQSYERPVSGLVRAFVKDTKGVLAQQVKGDVADSERRLLAPFSKLIAGGSKLLGAMTARLAAVPAPTGDETTVAAWLQGRRTYKRIAQRAVRAGKRRDAERMLELLDKAGKAVDRGDLLVAGFGFRRCL